MRDRVIGLLFAAAVVVWTGCCGPHGHRPFHPLVSCNPCPIDCDPCIDCGVYHGGCGTAACATPCMEPCPPACPPCIPPMGECGPSVCRCHGPFTWLFRSLTHGCYWGTGCGEAYWGDWISYPPDCYDPCGLHGEYIGSRTAARDLYHPKPQPSRAYAYGGAMSAYSQAGPMLTSDCPDCQPVPTHAAATRAGWTPTQAQRPVMGQPTIVSDRAQQVPTPVARNAQVRPATASYPAARAR